MPDLSAAASIPFERAYICVEQDHRLITNLQWCPTCAGRTILLVPALACLMESTDRGVERNG